MSELARPRFHYLTWEGSYLLIELAVIVNLGILHPISSPSTVSLRVGFESDMTFVANWVLKEKL